jgi:hypothetical protein
MKALLTKDYFHGNIDRAKAVQRLAAREEGTWLLRLRDPFDPRYPGCPFAISQIKDKKPIQRLIQHNPRADKKEWIVPVHGKDRAFASLDELLTCKDLKLKNPCDKSEDTEYTRAESDSDEEDVDPTAAKPPASRKS